MTTQTPVDIYLTDETYTALRAELLALIVDPQAHDHDTELVRILGETGGVWPQSVLNDPERSAAA